MSISLRMTYSSGNTRNEHSEMYEMSIWYILSEYREVTISLRCRSKHYLIKKQGNYTY